MTQAAPADLDDALAMLNGDAPGMPPRVDPAPRAAPQRDSELTVSTTAPMTPLQKADAKHSLAAGGIGYRIDIKGEYYANNPEGRGKIKRPYELSFNVGKAEGAPSIIKNKLLPVALKKKYPDAVRHRTFHVIRVVPRDPAKTPKSNNLAYMDREQLEQYVSFASVPVDLSTYEKTDEGTTNLREAVIDFVQNPDPVRLDEKGKNTVSPGDPGTFIFRERERQAKREGDRELRELNPDLDLV
jgi:hypothetical protein